MNFPIIDLESNNLPPVNLGLSPEIKP